MTIYEEPSLRSRRLEVVGQRVNGRARERHASFSCARTFFLVSFQAPATQAVKNLFRITWENSGSLYSRISTVGLAKSSVWIRKS